MKSNNKETTSLLSVVRHYRMLGGSKGNIKLPLPFKTVMYCVDMVAGTCCRSGMGVASCQATHQTFLLRASPPVSWNVSSAAPLSSCLKLTVPLHPPTQPPSLILIVGASR